MSTHDQAPQAETAAARERREQVETTRALELFGEWLQQAQHPVVEHLRSVSEPQVVVVGGTASDIGPRLGTVLNDNVTVEQIPHGCQVDDKQLAPEGVATAKAYIRSQLDQAFVQGADVIVLPYTINHAIPARGGTLGFAAKTNLQEPFRHIHAARTETNLVMVLNSNIEYEELFRALGWYKVHEAALTPADNESKPTGQMGIFVSGETILTPDNIALISEGDCILTGMITGLQGVGELLSDCIDDMGIKGAESILDFMDQQVALVGLQQRVATRLQRLSAALPQFMSHSDDRMRQLGGSFQVTEVAFAQLLSHIITVDQIAKNLVIAFDHDLTSVEIRAQIQTLWEFGPTVEAWYRDFIANAKSVGDNPAYQAYRVVTEEVDRRESVKKS